MEENSASQYRKAITARLKRIMEIVGLEVDGFVEFTQISKSHVYALLNGRKTLTAKTADKIAACLNLTGAQILKLDYELPISIRKTPQLKKFNESYPNNPEYFKRTKGADSIAYFFEHTLMDTTLFDKPVNVKEIRVACIAYGKDYSSKKISQTVNYMALKKKLNKANKLLLKKNGEPGMKEVPFFSTKEIDKDAP